jgi:FSR family fosmidomycin resistance protein-like MFS transporter
VLGISTIVALVFFIAGLMQVFGGWLADKISPKSVYIGAFFIQVPLLVLLANVAGPFVVVAAIIMMATNNSALPAENVILARYVPRSRRALAFGFKFVLAIGFATLGVQLEAELFDATGEFYWLFTVLAAFALAGAAMAFVLPSEKRSNPAVQPAE